MKKIILSKEELIEAYIKRDTSDKSEKELRSILKNHATINNAMENENYFELLTTDESNNVYNGMFKVQMKLRKENLDNYKEMLEIEKHNRVAKLLRGE